MAQATTRQIAIHTPGLTVLFQYPMRTAAALSSAGRTIVQLYLWVCDKQEVRQGRRRGREVVGTREAHQ